MLYLIIHAIEMLLFKKIFHIEPMHPKTFSNMTYPKDFLS